MPSAAASVDAYLADLPEDRREAISAVRDVVVAHLPTGIVETIAWGMISYEVPLDAYPDTYNGRPLLFAALASQKNHMALYLTALYGSERLREEFEDAYRATGKRLDMGKSCVRFRRLDDLPLDVVGRAIASCSAEELCAVHDRAAALRAARRKPSRP